MFFSMATWPKRFGLLTTVNGFVLSDIRLSHSGLRGTPACRRSVAAVLAQRWRRIFGQALQLRREILLRDHDFDERGHVRERPDFREHAAQFLHRPDAVALGA